MAEELKQEETVASENTVIEDNIEKDDNSELPKEPKKIDNLEKALRIFKRKSAGIISEVRKREAYDSPSVKRKKKSKEAQRKKRMGYKRGRNYQ